VVKPNVVSTGVIAAFASEFAARQACEWFRKHNEGRLGGSSAKVLASLISIPSTWWKTRPKIDKYDDEKLKDDPIPHSSAQIKLVPSECIDVVKCVTTLDLALECMSTIPHS
jgi:hypothetical protein